VPTLKKFPYLTRKALGPAFASAFNRLVTVITLSTNHGVESAFASRNAVASKVVKLNTRANRFRLCDCLFKLRLSFQDEHFIFLSKFKIKLLPITNNYTDI
jgi:hypothetical protein